MRAKPWAVLSWRACFLKRYPRTSATSLREGGLRVAGRAQVAHASAAAAEVELALGRLLAVPIEGLAVAALVWSSMSSPSTSQRVRPSSHGGAPVSLLRAAVAGSLHASGVVGLAGECGSATALPRLCVGARRD